MAHIIVLHGFEDVATEVLNFRVCFFPRRPFGKESAPKGSASSRVTRLKLRSRDLLN